MLAERPEGLEAVGVPDDVPVPAAAARSCGRGRGRHALRRPRLPGPARPADHPLRLARRDGHRGPRRANGVPASARRAWSTTRPTSTRLRQEDLLGFEGFGEISVDNLLAAIEASKQRPLRDLLIGLGIKHLGGPAATLLARTFGTSTRSSGASEADLAAVEGVGPIIAASVHRWFDDPRNQPLVDKLRAAGVDLGRVEVSRVPQVLAGKASWSPARSTASAARRPRRRSSPAAARRPERCRRRRLPSSSARAGRREAHQGRGPRRPHPRRGRLRRAARDRRGAGWLSPIRRPRRSARGASCVPTATRGPSTESTSPSRRARSTASSGRTAPASPPSCGCCARC